MSLPGLTKPKQGASLEGLLTAKDLLARRKQAQEAQDSTFKLLLYGPPGGGKTVAAATVAEMPSIKRVLWFDLESGFDSVLCAENADGAPFLSEAALEKIHLVQVEDKTVLDPGTQALLNAAKITDSGKAEEAKSFGAAAKLLLPFFTSQAPVAYGKAQFSLASFGPSDCIVLDSGTQFASSLHSLAIQANPNHVDGRKQWGDFTVNALAALSAIQGAKCNVIMVCHALEQEAEYVETGSGPTKQQRKVRDARTLPWFGSAKFSTKVGHYFGTLVYMTAQGGQFKTASLPGTMPIVAAKTRTGVDTSTVRYPAIADMLGQSALGKASRVPVQHAQGQGQGQTQSPGSAATAAKAGLPGLPGLK